MTGFLDVPDSLAPVQAAIAEGLARVERRFDEQLRSDLPPVARLVEHVERYRGKMLRPVLVLVSGMAAAPGGRIADEHITVAAVCEMIHMATLVHDDVLDEADTRRRGRTVNRLHGNETAVILGDYLIAAAYHLCSQLDSQKVALLVGQISMTVCAGELLQLHHRDDFSLDEPTYFEILDRKTASLIGLACRLGAAASGADEATCRGLERFGRRLGIAFQIQDDLLDLTGNASTVGKTVGRDLAKGKLTLPMIHHLGHVRAIDRGRALTLLERACADAGRAESPEAAAELAEVLDATGSVAHAKNVAASLVAEAKASVADLTDSPAKAFLLLMADAVIDRSF